MRTLRATVLFGFLAVAVLPGLARSMDSSYENKQGYEFWEVWWEEYRSDEQTALLLHFGKPGTPAWTKWGDALQQEDADEADEAIDDALGGLDAGGGPGGPGGPGGMGGLGGISDDFAAKQQESKKRARGRDRSAEAPAGMVYDYSPNHKNYKLPKGLKKVENGRFGAGLRLNGSTGLRVKIFGKGGDETIEGWFRFEKLPAGTVCLFDNADGGPRMLLAPDGTVSLSWESKAAGDRVTLTADQPLEAGRWTHLAGHAFWAKHIEIAKNDWKQYHEFRLVMDGRIAANIKRTTKDMPEPFVRRADFTIGMDVDGKRVATCLVDEVRVAGLRRFNARPRHAWFDPAAERPLVFGPPHFAQDSRVAHAGFESLAMRVPDGAEMTWTIRGGASPADLQVPGVYGKALLVDPALGFPRIPVKGLNPKEGTLEMWIQPVNWDNHTDFGKINWGDHIMSVARVMGRVGKSKKIVPFMTLKLARATIHGEAKWIHPGQWSHFVWRWSPDMVTKKKGWGGVKAGTPISTFRAMRFGELIYRAMLRRDIKLLDRIQPLYLELGITDDIKVRYGQRPAILVDEVVVYDRKLSDEEYEKTVQRWKGELPAE